MTLSNQAVVTLYLIIAFTSAVHALINKRDSRSSLIWIILSFMIPFIGSLSYYIFGINRTKRIAKKLKHPENLIRPTEKTKQKSRLKKGQIFAQITDGIEDRSLLFGNQVTLLRHGEGTYPAMLEVINHAKSFIVLSTYIFDNDHTGNQFVEALSQAKSRGVDVYVLIDGVGVLYAFPSIIHKLKKITSNVLNFFH